MTLSSDFASRLNGLFAAITQPAAGVDREREEWNNSVVTRVAVELGSDDRPVLTRQHLGMLRSGERTQPSLRVATAIAAAFAELSRRSGEPCSANAILSYLAGEPGSALHDLTDPRQLRVALRDDSEGSPSVEVLGRLGDLGDAETLEAVQTLIDRLSKHDAEPARRRLAGLLGLRTNTANLDPDRPA